MAIYLTRRCLRNVRRMQLQDYQLQKAAAEVLAGRYDADLGGGVIKKRVAIAGGKRGGARFIVFFRRQETLFFYDGWAKADVSGKGAKEIEDDELEAYKVMAKTYLSWDAGQIQKLLDAGMLIEV